jgi:GT2 family glycosyltransferase
VLGMHRSGTSAITRGLMALGVALGDRLMGGTKEDNEKGFWEDVDLNALNIELLQHFGLDWHALSPINRKAFEREDLTSFRLRAVELIRKKIELVTVFGIKDPRTARLLPFWKSVFDHLGIEPSYVIASRHPMSVARSLTIRNGFEEEKSYYLWLDHIVLAVLGSEGCPRVVVSYDRLMERPEEQLCRIATTLNLPHSRRADAVEEYTRDFLDENLRHTQFQCEDLRLNPAVPEVVIDAYTFMEKMASDELSIDSRDVRDRFDYWAKYLREISPALGYMARRDRQIADFNEKLTERDGQIATLNGQIATLNGLLNQKDEQLTVLTMDRDRFAGDVAKVAKVVAERDRQIAILTSEVTTLRTSTCWKITAPLRIVGDHVKQVKRHLRILPGILQRNGGVKETARKAIFVYRREGLPGVKQRLRTTSPVGQDAWNEYRQTFNREIKPKIIRRVREMDSQPCISIIVATYNTHETMLREMIESVQWQLYPNWELCIADDGSTQPHVQKILKDLAANDRRIRVRFGLENRGVSHALNRALEMAKGDFVVLLDHDDILEEQALFRIAESVLEEDPDMVYSDEVLVTPDAATVTQFIYRPAFSPEFLRGHPYIVHLVGFSTQLLRDIGGFNEKLFISQDYDLILRVSERARTIVHIPEILYRWRVHSNSAGHQKMQEVMETSQGVLQRHLERCGVTGTVHKAITFNLFDVRYPLRTDLSVAIIIPTKNHGDILRRCIESMRATISEVQYDIIVIDHESDDPATLTYLSSISPGVRVLRYKGAFNFSAINNFAVSQIVGEYSHYLFCNNDIEAITPGWLERMLELGQHDSVGIVGAKLLYPDRKTIQHAGVCVGAFGRAEHYGKFLRLPEDRIEPGYFGGLVINHEVAAVTAACLLIRKETFEEISGFDESFAVGFGDVDICLRAAARGNRILFCAQAQLVHYESTTRGTSSEDTHPEDTALYRSKWRQLLEAGDPYYNPGLSLESTTWQVKPQLNRNSVVRRRIVKRDKESGRDDVAIISAAIS